MLQIRLKPLPTPEGGGGAKVESVTVACPDHLILADLPVAKSLGSATAASPVKTVGFRRRRQFGDRVHFCVRCDFPIAIYGRLSPCEHVFCLDCARSDSLCYLCDERIQKIQTIKLMEGIFICAAPHCLKSFLKRTEFESHINDSHADLLGLTKKDGIESDAISAKKPTSSDSTVQAPPRPVLSSTSNSQIHNLEDKTHHRMQPRDQSKSKSTSSGFGQIENHPSEPPQRFDTQGNPHPLPLNVSEYPMHPTQPPNFAVIPPAFGYPPFGPDGAQSVYSAPFQMMQSRDAGTGQGSLLGFPPGGMNFSERYPQPWNMGMHSESSYSLGIVAPQPLPLPPPPPLPPPHSK